MLDHLCVACMAGRHDACPGCPCTHEAGATVYVLNRNQSTDQARTARNEFMLSNGIHPATRRPLAGDGETCATCVHVVRNGHGDRGYWKCQRHIKGVTGGPGTDIRVSWPACTLHATRPQGA